MNISNTQSLFNTLGTTTTTKSSLNTSTNFADYFFNATSKAEQDKEKTNSLFNDLSSFGTSSALQNLLSGQGGTDAVSSYLHTSMSSTANPSATDTFSTYLQTNFQSQQMNILSTAKDKLTAQMTAFEQAMGENPNEAATLRLEQMKQNIRTVESYLADKQQQQTVKNDLLNQMQSSSAFTQYLLSQQKSIF